MQLRLVLFILLFMIGGVATSFAEQAKERYKVVFSAFDMSNAGQFAYLRDSIQGMLASRLASKDRVELVDRTFSKDELETLRRQPAKSTAVINEVAADYIVTGELFSLTGGLNIQVALYPVKTTGEVLRFSVIVKKLDTLITDVHTLAEEIATSAFGYKLPGADEDTSMTPRSDTDSGFVTVHPEAAYKKKQYTGTVIGVQGSGISASTTGVKRTATLSDQALAMVVGDADGDGVDDIFILSGGYLHVYQAGGRDFEQAGELRLPTTQNVHAVNLADLNGDGKVEIYLSGTSGLNVSSSVVEWDKTRGFTTIQDNIPWYLRPVYIPAKGWRLVGQQRGVEKIELIQDGLYYLDIDTQNNLKKSGRLSVPRGVNLFDFVYADIDGDKAYETITIDQNERLRVYGPGNDLLWVSKNTYGGSKVYLGPSQGEAVDENSRNNLTVNEDADREIIFIPGRMVVTDVDQDGRQEIVVNDNIVSAWSFFKRLRFYKGGAVTGLVWNGEVMKEAWRTGQFPGFIVDFRLFWCDGEERKSDTSVVDTCPGRLYIINQQGSGSLMALLPGGTKSQLTLYDLEFSVKKGQ